MHLICNRERKRWRSPGPYKGGDEALGAIRQDEEYFAPGIVYKASSVITVKFFIDNTPHIACTQGRT